MIKKFNMTKLHNNQTGLVSFMVVTIIMIVLTLIVLAFARIVQREQVQTLDRQLNAQAFYAAESGVNDAIGALAANNALSAGIFNDCDDFTTAATLTPNLGNGVSYSCLLVDPSPDELIYDNISTTESVVLPINSDGASPITELRFVIKDSDNGGPNRLTACPATGTYPGIWPTANCSIGMLRLELVEFNGSTNRSGLLRNRGVMYIQPSNTGTGTLGRAWGDITDETAYRTGQGHSADCSTVSGVVQCNLNLSGLNIQNGYLRLRSVYRSVGLTISARSGAGPINLIGAQAEIDATGRANGVIKRIKVRSAIPIDTNSDGPVPEFALQSTDTICKRFQLTGAPANILLFGLFLNATTGANDDCNPGQTSNN